MVGQPKKLPKRSMQALGIVAWKEIAAEYRTAKAKGANDIVSLVTLAKAIGYAHFVLQERLDHIALEFGKTRMWCSQVMTILRLVPDTWPSFEGPEHLGMDDARTLRSLRPEKQPEGARNLLASRSNGDGRARRYRGRDVERGERGQHG